VLEEEVNAMPVFDLTAVFAPMVWAAAALLVVSAIGILVTGHHWEDNGSHRPA
jgi:hypothetical protein